MNITLDIDAPRDPAYTRRVAEAAAECLRVLCHATHDPDSGALRYPNDVDAVLRSLASMASCLPQMLSQLDVFLQAGQAAGRIKMDSGTRCQDPALAADAVRLHLLRAASGAGQLRGSLDQAASVTSGMAAAGDSD